MARRKLSDIRQENKSAHELLHEIVELYEIAAYTEDIEQLKELINIRSFNEILLCIYKNQPFYEQKSGVILTSIEPKSFRILFSIKNKK